MDVNKECVDYITWIGWIGENIANEVRDAGWNGLKEHEFSENDLEYLKAKHAELYDVWNNLPSFENVIHYNRPVACGYEYNPEEYPCSECRGNKKNRCKDIEEADRRLQEIRNAESK